MGTPNGEAGFYFDTMVYCVLNGCAADSNAVGYVLKRCQGVTLTSCGAESTVATGSNMGRPMHWQANRVRTGCPARRSCT
jgi:hypothetical protein